MNHIDVKIDWEEGRMTVFYGHPNSRLRPESWELLKNVGTGSKSALVVGILIRFFTHSKSGRIAKGGRMYGGFPKYTE